MFNSVFLFYSIPNKRLPVCMPYYRGFNKDRCDRCLGVIILRVDHVNHWCRKKNCHTPNWSFCKLNSSKVFSRTIGTKAFNWDAQESSIDDSVANMVPFYHFQGCWCLSLLKWLHDVHKKWCHDLLPYVKDLVAFDNILRYCLGILLLVGQGASDILSHAFFMHNSEAIRESAYSMFDSRGFLPLRLMGISQIPYT